MYDLEKRKCSRCGNDEELRKNGLCIRCDDVLYGRKTEDEEDEDSS